MRDWKKAFGAVLPAAALLVASGCNRDWNGQAGATPMGAAPGQVTASAGANAPLTPAGHRPQAGGMSRGNGFAGLPDHGDLVGYPRDKVLRREGAYSWHRADFSEAHALNAAVKGGVLKVTTPSGSRLDFEYERHVEHPSGDWTWVGRIRDGSRATEAILTFGAEAVFGLIDQPGAGPLRITMRDGASWMVETDLAQEARLGGAAAAGQPDFMVPPRLPDSAGHAPASTLQMASLEPSAIDPSLQPPVMVDLVVGYTPGFRDAYGTAGAAVTRLNQLVEITNEAYVNSAVRATVRMVQAVLVNYPDATSNNTALEELTGYDGDSIPVNPAFNALRAARDQYGADLVTLVRKFNQPENESCGVAWLIGGGQSNVHAGYETYGYSVVSDGRDQGSDGKTYFCREETLAHELGHNMGSQHDVGTAQGDDNVLQSDEYGRYAYSFGYKTGAGAGDFYTIMAYGDRREDPPYQVSYRVFSNPRINFCGGFACGVANQSDNATSLGQMIPIIATFRDRVVPVEPGNPPQFVRNDVDGDGNSDLLWRSDSATRMAYWIMQESVRERYAIHAVGTQWTVVAKGDLTGDGLVDLVWSNGTLLYLWASNGNGFDVTRMRNEPAGWDVFAAGDIDGDNKDDLVWRSEDRTRFAYWIMDGANYVRAWTATVGPVWQLTIADDLTGDGKLDLVWTNGSRLVLWTGNGTSFSAATIMDHPAGWTLVDSGDVNGDGKADLVWRNDARTHFGYWLMNGASRTAVRVWTVGSQWRVAAVGDYNGDGLADITWASSTRLVQWVGNGSGFVGKNIGAYPTGWTLLR